MTERTLRILRALLAWDRARIASLETRYNLSDYRARADRAESALDATPESWSQEIREFWQVLVEVHGEMAAGLTAERETVGIGVQRVPRQPDEARDFEVMRSVAAEIGVLPVLQGAGSGVWRRP